MSSNYKRNVLAITIAHSSCEYWSSACDMIFPAAGNGAIYSCKFLLQVLQQNSGKSCSNKMPLYKTPTLVWLSDRLCNWKRSVWLCYFNAWRNCFYCCHVMKFDWSCQLSSSRSNNLNLQKLTGHLFYNLGMRLKCTADDLSPRVTTKILAMAAILTKYPVLLWVCLQWVQ